MLYFTQVTYGRPQTETEIAAIKNYLDAPAVAPVTMQINFDNVIANIAGTTVSFNDNYVRLFSTETSADGYLALVNGFTPPPQLTNKLS